MNQTKLRIDLSQGIIEAEGSEEFVQNIYLDFKDQIQQTPINDVGKSREKKNITPKPPKKDTKKQRKTGTKKETHKIVKDLDLSGKGNKPNLKDFYGQFSPKSNFEKNLIFCYYLQNKINHSPITMDDVFTCYRHIAEIKAPGALKQSLYDTASIRGWIDTSSLENIVVPIAGINYLEHDLAKSNSEN